MADYKFPNVNFDWLGELPDVYRSAKAYRERGEALADLPENASPDQLRQAANRMLRSPDLKSQEAGQRLYQMALGREGLAQKNLADKMWIEMYGKTGGGLRLPGMGGTPPAGAEPSVYDAVGAQPQQLPSPFQPPPTGGFQLPQDRRSELAPGSPMGAETGPVRVAALGGAPPSMPSEGAPQPPMSPSDAMIAQAQGGMSAQPAPPPPTQLAQSGMAEAARIPIGPAAQPPPPPSRGVAGSPDTAQAQAEAQHWVNEINRIPPALRNSAQAQAAKTGLQNALGRMKLDKDQIHWNMENAQRKLDGQPPISYTDFQNEVKNNPEFVKQSVKDFDKIRTDSANAGKLLNTAVLMGTIVNDKRFTSGAPEVAGMKARLIGAVGELRQAGVPVDAILPQGWQNIQDTVKLQEAFTALSNQAIYDKLGTLGNQISEGDRNFINAAFPSLRNTPEGNKLLIKILTAQAQHAVEAGQRAGKYMNEKRTRATPWELAEAAESPLFANKDGSLTEHGKKLFTENRKQLEASGLHKTDEGRIETVPRDQLITKDGVLYQWDGSGPPRPIRRLGKDEL